MEGAVEGKRIRILVAKPGLDGHDRGAKVMAFALRDAGMEVIYTGLHQTIDQIVNTAIQEDVDVIGLSIMSGAHLPICDKLMKQVEEKKMDDVLVVVGGVIPKQDLAKLRAMGIEGVFPGGTPFEESIRWIQEHVKRAMKVGSKSGDPLASFQGLEV
jgi:methylmalonyl-CoA mutase C-terminal domain/subunit